MEKVLAGVIHMPTSWIGSQRAAASKSVRNCESSTPASERTSLLSTTRGADAETSMQCAKSSASTTSSATDDYSSSYGGLTIRTEERSLTSHRDGGASDHHGHGAIPAALIQRKQYDGSQIDDDDDALWNNEAVRASLDQLEIELSFIREKPAYNQALAASYQHVKSRRFRLRFLRLDSPFSPADAARRLSSYFQLQRELFGADKVGKRRLALCDLSGQDLAEMATGHVQLLSRTSRHCWKTNEGSEDREDRHTGGHTHRPVLLCCMSRQKPLDSLRTKVSAQLHGLHAPIVKPQPQPVVAYSDDINRLMRILWYACSMAMLESQDCDTVAVVLYGIGLKFNLSGYQFDFLRKLMQLSTSMPFKMELIFCIDDSRFQTAIEMAKIGFDTLRNMKVFTGSYTESKYALLTCGIPPNSLPMTESGTLDRSSHLEWLRWRKRVEGFTGEVTL